MAMMMMIIMMIVTITTADFVTRKYAFMTLEKKLLFKMVFFNELSNVRAGKWIFSHIPSFFPKLIICIIRMNMEIGFCIYMVNLRKKKKKNFLSQWLIELSACPILPISV